MKLLLGSLCLQLRTVQVEDVQALTLPFCFFGFLLLQLEVTIPLKMAHFVYR